MPAPRWIVTQIGSREHFACPQGFHDLGALGRLYTDIWAGPLLRSAGKIAKPLSGLASRHNPLVPDRLVVGFNFGGLKWLRYQKSSVRGRHRTFENYSEVGEWFATSVREHLKSHPLDPASHILYAFSTGALESAVYARQIGMPVVVNQLDPARVDEWMFDEERERWPDWQPAAERVPESYFRRLCAEWDAADLVAVNSEFSKRSLVAQGLSPEKIFVVPLAYTPEVASPPVRSFDRTKPLHVLWLGGIALRKGIPYLVEAARILEQRKVNVRISIAGPIVVNSAVFAQAPANTTVLGHVTRDQALALYSDGDVFVLPTISDGFALTQLEAMSFGQPVIVTPNCGDVVTDNVDGFLIPIRNPQALADKIQLLAEDRDRLAGMSQAALAKSKLFTIERYTRTIQAAAERLAGK